MALSCFCFSMGFFFFLVYCGQYALEIGAGTAAPYVLIACNAASLLGRISSGVVADRLGYFNVLILELVVTCIIIFGWISIKSVPVLFVAAVFYGLVTGGNIALQGPCVIAVTRDLGCAGTLIGQLYGKSGSVGSQVQTSRSLIELRNHRLSIYRPVVRAPHLRVHPGQQSGQTNGKL
jgi:MFS family permease